MLSKQLRPRTRLKVAASALLAVPIVLLLLLAVGEMAEGERSGAQHLLQAAPLLFLLIAAWRYPGAAGIALLGLAAILFPIWLLFVITRTGTEPDGTAILIWVGTGLVLFVPPLVAGWLLVKAGWASPGA